MMSSGSAWLVRKISLPHAQDAEEQHIRGRVRKGQVSELAYPGGGQAQLEAKVERR
jgi:hypothetical protein